MKNNISNSQCSSAIIINDHPIARMAMINILESEGLKEIYEAEDALIGLKLIREKHPGLVILDIDIPIINGIEVLNKLREMKYPGIIIVFSAKNEKFYGKRSAEFGANAFVRKKDGISTIISAIRAVRDGYSYYPFSFELSGGICATEMELLNSLSLQEINVMNYINKGFNGNFIAEKMNISCKTVSTYKRRVMSKLQCESFTDLLSFLQRNNID